MAKSKRFQYKLWRIVNHCRSGGVKWSKTGDSIIFNFSKFQREYLEANDDFCKSSNISSFIRQLNLYRFRKLIDLSRTNQSNQDEKEYINPYFMKGRPDLLNQVVRKPLKPLVESNVRVKKELLSDEDSATQENVEGVSRNHECSRSKSNNLSIQGKTEASRRSTRKRKLNKMSLTKKMFPENRKGSCNIASFCVDMDKHVNLSQKNSESINLASKQFPKKRKGFGDIESLYVGMDKHVNLSQKNNELVPNQVSTLMLAPPCPSTSKVETSSAVGNKTLVKFLPPPCIEPQNIERLKIIPEQNSAPKLMTMKRLGGNQPISDDALILLRKNYDEDDDPFFLHEGSKDIVLTQAIGNSRKCNLLRI